MNRSIIGLLLSMVIFPILAQNAPEVTRAKAGRRMSMPVIKRSASSGVARFLSREGSFQGTIKTIDLVEREGEGRVVLEALEHAKRLLKLARKQETGDEYHNDEIETLAFSLMQILENAQISPRNTLLRRRASSVSSIQYSPRSSSRNVPCEFTPRERMYDTESEEFLSAVSSDEQ